MTVLFSLWAVAAFSGCQTLQNPNVPPPHRPDEQALLEIALQNILDLERKKDYITLYEDYASQDFRQRVPLRDFLRLANCTETYLGDFQRYDPETLAFVRKREAGRSVDILNLRVFRSGNELTERLVFVQEGLSFRFNSFRWLSTRNGFLTCLEEINRKKGLGSYSSQDASRNEQNPKEVPPLEEKRGSSSAHAVPIPSQPPDVPSRRPR